MKCDICDIRLTSKNVSTQSTNTCADCAKDTLWESSLVRVTVTHRRRGVIQDDVVCAKCFLALPESDRRDTRGTYVNDYKVSVEKNVSGPCRQCENDAVDVAKLTAPAVRS